MRYRTRAHPKAADDASRLEPLRARWNRLPHWVQVGLVPLVLAVLAFLYPYYVGSLPGAFPAVGTMVIMLVFTMMAVGLNIVVGYAGLLDLGYVAFYAVGAYTAAWFASLHFSQTSFHLGSVGLSSDAVGIHLSIWLVLLIAGGLHGPGGHPDRPADAPSAR